MLYVLELEELCASNHGMLDCLGVDGLFCMNMSSIAYCLLSSVILKYNIYMMNSTRVCTLITL